MQGSTRKEKKPTRQAPKTARPRFGGQGEGGRGTLFHRGGAPRATKRGPRGSLRAGPPRGAKKGFRAQWCSWAVIFRLPGSGGGPGGRPLRGDLGDAVPPMRGVLLGEFSGAPDLHLFPRPPQKRPKIGGIPKSASSPPTMRGSMVASSPGYPPGKGGGEIAPLPGGSGGGKTLAFVGFGPR